MQILALPTQPPISFITVDFEFLDDGESVIIGILSCLPSCVLCLLHQHLLAYPEAKWGANFILLCLSQS